MTTRMNIAHVTQKVLILPFSVDYRGSFTMIPIKLSKFKKLQRIHKMFDFQNH